MFHPPGCRLIRPKLVLNKLSVKLTQLISLRSSLSLNYFMLRSSRPPGCRLIRPKLVLIKLSVQLTELISDQFAFLSISELLYAPPVSRPPGCCLIRPKLVLNKLSVKLTQLISTLSLYLWITLCSPRPPGCSLIIPKLVQVREAAFAPHQKD